jgi:MFS family permease
MIETAIGQKPWWKEMNRYHWLVLIIASMSWMFDCMDQRFFNIVREPAMRSLLYGKQANAPGAVELTAEQKTTVAFYGRVATGMILLGWAVGGFFFGLLGDRIGRIKTMMITISIYAGFTGLSALSIAWWDFITYRFLMGLGVGGLFAAAVSLVAEVTPAPARPHALGLLQALSALGNVTGSAISIYLKPQSTLFGIENWRWLFLVGVLPALLVIAIQKTLKEPESWQHAKTRASEDLHKQLGAWRDLFSPGLCRNTLVGLTLAVVGVIGLWGVAFFSPELVRDATKPAKLVADLKAKYKTVDNFNTALDTQFPTWESLTQTQKGLDLLKKTQDKYVGIGLMLQDVGAFFGVYFFTVFAARIGRKLTFGGCFFFAFIATAAIFQFLRQPSYVFWMLPILGFWTLSVFGGYSIYFPELYPTRLRSSGVGFCYNVGRVITAVALFGSAYLVEMLKGSGVAEPFRVGSIIITGVYFLGIIALFWAPETKGRPLPED